MELTGLALNEVLMVLGGFAAVVTVLYLLRLRRRQVEVPFVHLWREVLAEKQTTRLASALKRILSWLLALAVVAALATAMGDPRYASATLDGWTTVVLIDASASMQATDVEGDRLGVARQRVARLIEGLGSEDRMLIAQMDASTVPLTPLTNEPHVLTAGLEALAPTDVAADADRAMRFALDVLRGAERPRVIFVSDGLLGELEPAVDAEVQVDWIRVGESGENLAITAFSVRRYPLDKSRSQVLVELWNPTEDGAAIELSLLGDGEPIDVQRLQLHAGERLRRIFEDVGGADRTLEARIARVGGGRDDLPVDDRAYARLPERRRARVLAVSPGNLYLSAALLLDEYLEVVEISPAEYPAEGRFDVTIFDGWIPPTPPDTHAIYLDPRPREGVEGPFVVTGAVQRPFFEHIEHDHPLVAFTALRDVNIAEALEVELRDGDRVIAGDEGAPLIVAGTRNDHRIVALLFDVRRSDLPLRVAWPLLLLNSVDFFVGEDSAYLSSYETGETWHVPVPAGVEDATLITPAGAERPVPVVEGRAVCTGLRAGFYTLRAGEEEIVFAANLGPSDEGLIAPADTLSVAGRSAEAPELGTPGVRTEIWMLLVLGVLAILLIEWFSFHRRLTV